ncbi:hypothetical protein DH2020_024415 [Rehmannia glutinosa]|uniref:Acyl-[acyl-carrier-protein] hydrolase n=1 Tax=Rehmannia glutinosa TaxID=99300 RepID=A0ABR0W510_REHGL
MLLTTGVFPASDIAAAAWSRRSCPFSSSIISPHSKAVAWRCSLSRPKKPDSLPVISVATTGEPKRSSHEPRVADEFKFGGLTEDGLSYKEKFIVRSYEVGINKTVTIQTIANFLQEVSCNHFLSAGYTTDGFSTTLTMRKVNLIWVTSRMHIEVYKYPAWNDVVEIETWCQCEGRIGARRDWILRDYSTGEVIGRATSKWLMMNQETRRFQKVIDDVRDEIVKYSPKSLRLAFPEENNACHKKIGKVDDTAQYSKLGLAPRRDDLDMNRHVNNVTYIGWVLESMPSEIIYNYELQSLTLDYRRECLHDDIIDSLTSPESDMSDEAGSEHQGINGRTPSADDDNGFLQFRHLLRLSSGDGSETNRGRTIWRKKLPAN